KGTTCPAGVTTNVNPFSTTCDMSLINPGTSNPTLANFRDWQNGDHYNYAPLNYLVTPNERTSLYVQGHYDLADNLTFNTMAIYNNRVSQQVLAPSPLFLGRSGTSVVNGEPITISAKNPYNPFGVDLTGGSTGAASTCAAHDTCDVLQFLGRRPLELGNRVFNQNTSSFAFRGGFNGYFNMFGNEWDWDSTYNYGNNYGSNLEVTNGGDVSGVVNLQNLQNALGYPGEAPCQISPTNTGLIPGCVPFNIFGGYNLQTGQGSITPAMAQYVLFEEHDLTSETMRDYTANLTNSSLFNLPAGPVGIALGGESLEHDAYEHPDSLVASGNSSGSKTAATDGREDTKAEYIEFNIPLVSDEPLMKSVSLDIANRWSQFTWKGGEEGVPGAGVQHSAANSSGRAALRWQATNDLLLRGSWSQGFRIPSVSEFFLGQSDSFPTLSDPCVASPATTKPGFCPAAAKQPNSQIRTTIGGNPDLTPERSISETVGFVYSPGWLPGFDFSADYYKINVLNPVSVIGGQTIMNGCYIGGNLNYCNLITRAGGTQGNYSTSGSITDILNTNVNIGGIKTEGVDINTDYKFPSSAIGDFKASLNVTFVKQYVATVPFGNGGLSSQEMSGTTSQSTINVPFSTGASGVVGGIPKQRANFALNWNYGDWSAVWNVDYISHLIEDCNALYSTAPAVASQLISTRCTTQSFSFPFDSAAVVPVNHIGATTYHDVSVTYHLDSWNTDFTLGIRNLFDKEPPIAMSAFANSFLPTLYRAPGRFFYGRIGVKF
ncbi:MAG: TonB-dependent receptor, partial [Gammaproteobacteria bacterium]